MLLMIERKTADEFKTLSESLFPKEACGMLASSEHDGVIDTFIPIPNISNDPQQFLLEPKVLIRQLYELEKQQKSWVGVIHSHPTSHAIPSEKDKVNWYYPNLSYWIYSIKDNELKAYYIRDKMIEPMEFKVI